MINLFLFSNTKVIYAEEPKESQKSYYNWQRNLVSNNEDIEKVEPSYNENENVKWISPLGKQFSSLLKC